MASTERKKYEKFVLDFEPVLARLDYEDEAFWGRQLRGGMSMSMTPTPSPSTCVCDVCPEGEVCDEDDKATGGSCARPPRNNIPFRLDDSYTCTSETDLSFCFDSQVSTACWIPQCNVADGICEYTNQVCSQDVCTDLCEEATLVSRCDCICFPKRCPIAEYVCDSSDGCCKDPSEIQ